MCVYTYIYIYIYVHMPRCTETWVHACMRDRARVRTCAHTRCSDLAAAASRGQSRRAAEAWRGSCINKHDLYYCYYY